MSPSDQADFDSGKNALKTYYGFMVSFFPVTYKKYSFEEFYNLLIKIKGGKALAIGLGLGIREAGLSSSTVNDSMKKLAQSGNGKIPASQYDFFKFLVQGSSNISYLDAAAFTALESFKDIGSGLESVGNQVILTGKILNFLMPVIALVVIYFLLNKYTDGQFTKARNGFKR